MKQKEVSSISVAEVTPEEFFVRYISPRQPIKFHNQLLSDVPWNVNLWTNQYLKDLAGRSQVKVEYRQDSSARFGQGNERTMEFGEFIDQISSGNQSLYLTTQKLNYSAEGQPMIVSHPITELLEDIPLRPKIMGNLIPQNINLWMGSSDRPTSSGLHHDFHDNLYILLRGQKTLVLYPPSEYRNMYLVGKVSQLHPNGRFNYQGQPTRADGSSIGSEEALKASKLLDEAVLRLENEVLSLCSPMCDFFSFSFVRNPEQKMRLKMLWRNFWMLKLKGLMRKVMKTRMIIRKVILKKISRKRMKVKTVVMGKRLSILD